MCIHAMCVVYVFVYPSPSVSLSLSLFLYMHNAHTITQHTHSAGVAVTKQHRVQTYILQHIHRRSNEEQTTRQPL